MNVLWAALIVCMGLVGCGKTPVAKDTAQVNSETLTLPQADAALGGSAAASSTAVQPAPSVSTNPVVSNVVENKDAGPLVGASASVPVASESAASTVDAAADSSDAPDGIAVQKALKNLGLYSGTLDGKIGPKTKEAIREFQKKNNLAADGKVGPKTWALLQKAEAH